MSEPKKEEFVPMPTSDNATQPTAPTPAATVVTPSNGQSSTSGMAIAGLVCAFIVPLLGLIFSIIGLNQTKDNKRGGRGLAIGGLIVSILGMLVGLFWIIAIFVAAANTDPYDYSSSISDISSTPKVVSGKLTEVVKVDDVELMVHSLTAYEPQSEYYTPDSGNRYISVTVDLKNTGSDSFSFGTYSFKVRDSTGLELNSAYVGAVSGELESGSLARGGSTSGVMIFEVPKDDSNLVLVFEPSYFGGEVAEVQL
jgi:hypothetical protein